ncbi:MAG: CDP-glycerol glycerophosphotransferase family protein [Treponema sp.]|nr:CDP-glycerol glycerophosphotransferase family protein [Treponema sp.]
MKAMFSSFFFDKIFVRIILQYGLYKIFYLLVPFLKINKNKVVFSSFRGNKYGDNPKYIAEELHKEMPEMQLVWLINRLKNVSEIDFPPYIKVVNQNSFKALYELATAKFWVDNFRKAFFVPKRKGQFYLQLWHGALALKGIEKDVEDKLEKKYVKQAKKDSKYTDLCVAGTQHLHNIYKNSFWYDGKIIDTGSPRNDILFSTDEAKKSEIRKQLNCAEEEICLYAPTFRNNADTSVYNIDYKLLKSTLEQKFGGTWKIFIRLHPQMVFMKSKLNIPDFVTDVSAYPDSQELLLVSECVVTDYSSIIYDFAITKRPAFIFATDYEYYKQSERSLYFSLEETPFKLSQTNEQLVKNINSFNLPDYEEELNEFNKKFGVFDNGTSSSKVCEIILKNRENKTKEITL